MPHPHSPPAPPPQAFFLTPGGEAAFGRTLLGKGPLLDWIYPLYFRMTLGPTVVPRGCTRGCRV